MAGLFLGWGEVLLGMSAPLDVELSVARIVSLPRTFGMNPQVSDLVLTAALVEDVADHASDEVAAVLRAVVAVSSKRVRSAAVTALGEVTEAGFYPPSWAGQIGLADPVAAWRRYDVYGDRETVAIEFAYGPDRHVLMVETDLFRPRDATGITIEEDPAAALRSIQDGADPLYRWEELDLASARARAEPALVRCEQLRNPNLPEESVAVLPVAMSRMRRLPRAEVSPPEVSFDADDRRSAVSAFLATLAASEAVSEVGDADVDRDLDVVRFWAEVLAGYSSLVDGTPPTRVGPVRVSHIVLGHVPTMIELTPAQRRGMPAVVSAWTNWAASQSGLDPVAREHLMGALPAALDGFDAAYDDPDNVQHRAYLRDQPATTLDPEDRAATFARRAIAVPLPDARVGDSARSIIDVSDPAGRRTVIRDEYGDCDPPEGMPVAVFLDAVVRVSEQLWHNDPPQVWHRAQELIRDGVRQHEILHELAGQPADR